MSQKVTYNAEQNWNYVGRFYGIDPTVLAAYNGQIVAPSTAIPKGFKLAIPNASELTKFYPEYQKLFATAEGKFGAVLRPPTLTVAIADSALVASDGNMTIVNAARMRRFSHTGDNYGHGSPARTPNPTLEGGSAYPDARKLSFASEWWKCNILVGDTLYTAGYDWPKSEFHRYLQPSGMLKAMSVKNPYADIVWVSPHFQGAKVSAADPYIAPTAADLANVKPGDVVLLHDRQWDSVDEAGHSAIVSGAPRVQPDGTVQIRVVDIYGEQWYDVAQHHVKAILRPKKKLSEMPAQTVGGNPNKPEDVLDGGEDINGTDTPSPQLSANG
jgi:hypothetical protein